MPLPRVIVTRPRREADEWVAQLRQHGLAADALPLIDIRPVPLTLDATDAAAAVEQPADYAALLFVSSNAVREFFGQKQPFSDRNRPLAQYIRARIAIKSIANDTTTPPPRALAPGPGTVAALIEAGVPAAQIDAPAQDAAQFDSQALWQQIGARDWTGQRVLVVRGQSGWASGGASGDVRAPGRDWIAAQWRAAGAQVDFATVYERICPQLGAAERELAQSASADGSVWLLSSSEAVGHLAAALALDLKRARALATHPRIAEAARQAGWREVAVSRPALPDVVHALRSIEWLEP